MKLVVNGERIKQVRELCGFNQTELANRIEITQPAITLIESNRLIPSEEVLTRISFQTGFPVSFFKQEQSIEIPLGSLLFRSKQKATVKERTQVYRFAQTIYELIDFLLKNVKNIPVRVPRIIETPSEAAKLTRSSLGLSPDKPIAQLINILEKAGVIIISLPIYSDLIDAFSFWVDNLNPRPVIAVATGGPVDRLRFSIAHELGHLVLHSSARGNGQDVEDEAHQFAGEFLLPEKPMREEMFPPIKLSDLAELKLRWKVAMSALIVRADRLNIITKRQYKYLFQQMGIRGWRTHEPANLEPPIEKPRLLCQLIELRYGSPIDIKKVSNELHLPPQFVEQILNHYLCKEPMEKTTIERKVLPANFSNHKPIS